MFQAVNIVPFSVYHVWYSLNYTKIPVRKHQRAALAGLIAGSVEGEIRGTILVLAWLSVHAVYSYLLFLISATATSDINDEIPHEFYKRLRKRISSKVGSKSAFGMDCREWLREKKIGKTKDNYGMLTLYVKRG